MSGRAPAGVLNAPAHRHRRPAREGEQLAQRHPGPQQDGQVQPAGGRQERPPPGAPAAGLLLRQQDGALRRTLRRHGLELGISGVHKPPGLHPSGEQASRRELSGNIRSRQHGRRPGQPVPLPGGGVDDPALLPEGGDALPHRRPGDAKRPADLLAGQPALRPGQQLDDLPAVHCSPSCFVNISVDSVDCFPRKPPGALRSGQFFIRSGRRCR